MFNRAGVCSSRSCFKINNNPEKQTDTSERLRNYSHFVQNDKIIEIPKYFTCIFGLNINLRLEWNQEVRAYEGEAKREQWWSAEKVNCNYENYKVLMINIFLQHIHRNKFRVTVYILDLDYNLEATYKTCCCCCPRHSPNSILPRLYLPHFSCLVSYIRHSARGQHY